MARSFSITTGYQNDIRYHAIFDADSNILKIYEELRYFPKRLIHSENIKKKTSDEELRILKDKIISGFIKDSKPFDSYTALVERGFVDYISTDDINAIALNGNLVSFRDNEFMFNANLFEANPRNTAIVYRIAQLCGQLKQGISNAR